jgi:hypothetical protein
MIISGFHPEEGREKMSPKLEQGDLPLSLLGLVGGNAHKMHVQVFLKKMFVGCLQDSQLKISHAFGTRLSPPLLISGGNIPDI